MCRIGALEQVLRRLILPLEEKKSLWCVFDKLSFIHGDYKSLLLISIFHSLSQLTEGQLTF